jgi:hypothetical protein
MDKENKKYFTPTVQGKMMKLKLKSEHLPTSALKHTQNSKRMFAQAHCLTTRLGRSPLSRVENAKGNLNLTTLSPSTPSTQLVDRMSQIKL